MNVFILDCAENKHTKLDIGFVMAYSGSNTYGNWNQFKLVAKQIVGLHNFGVDGIQAGVVTLSDNATLKIKFSAHSTKSAFETALDLLDSGRYWGNSRRILPVLETAITAMFNPNNGMRTESEKVAILITDGPENAQGTEYEKMAKRFKQKDIRLKVVRVGNFPNDPLKLLVSHENDYVSARNFKYLLNEGRGFEVEDIC